MKLGVIGCGNVGLNTLRAFAAKGIDVAGYDISSDVKERILTYLGPKALADDFKSLASCDIVFECLPTDPIIDSGACDLSILQNTVRAFADLEPLPRYKCRLFVQRSTCPPGTARKLSAEFKKTEYAVNPSFLRKKTQWEDSISPERIAIGGSPASVRLLKEIYQPFDAPFFVSGNYEVVELLKYVENIIDATLISLWNEFLLISDKMCIPPLEFCKLIDCLGDRDKFRSTARVPGQAFGMWCLPKDIAAIIHEFGLLEINVIRAAMRTNEAMRKLYGENSNAGSELFFFRDGRLKLTALGYTYLASVWESAGQDV